MTQEEQPPDEQVEELEARFREHIKSRAEASRQRTADRKKVWNDLFPMTIDRIAYGDEPVVSQGWSGPVGSFVSIRPTSDDNPEGKTFLGLFLGDIAVSLGVAYSEGESGRVLTVNRSLANPAIFVFALKRIVFGYESWWGVIEDESELATISDADINDVWYVKALRSLSKAADSGTEEE